VYKLFTKVILNRISNTLDEEQPREQAGFRSHYSTIDHLFTINRLLETAKEHRLPICLAFVDYEKAFDSVEFNAVLQALANQGIDDSYIRILLEANTGCTTEIQLKDNVVTVPICKGVKQGDTISPKLFTARLENLIRQMNLQGGIEMDGEELTNLRLGDDIVLISSNIGDLQGMLQELEAKSKEIGLKINKSKTKVMRTPWAKEDEVKIDGERIEEVTSYVYLGQEISASHDIRPEINRRIRAGWKAFGSIRSILAGKASRELRARLYNTVVLPAMTYGCETWTITKTEEQMLKVSQRAMERAMLRITIKDKVKCEEIRRLSQVKDIITEITRSKMRWAGHVVRMADNRWTTRILGWYPRNLKRPKGRPFTRWEELVKKKIGTNWVREARNRQSWKVHCDPRNF